MQSFRSLWSQYPVIRYFSLISSFIILQFLFINASSSDVISKSKKFVKGRILVQPRAGLSQEKLDQILKTHGGKAVSKIKQINVHVIEVPEGAEEAVRKALNHNPNFEFAELDQIAYENFVPNDQYFNNQWHLPLMKAPEAWDVSQGSGIVIAILDSGVDPTHPDLMGRLVPGYNFYDGNTNSADVRGHGTKVAGAAAASTNNSSGVASLAGQALIMPIRVSNIDGYVTWSTMAQGLLYAADHGARIANMSFNGVAGSSSVLSAAKYFKDKGGLSIISAGNDNIDPGYANTDLFVIVSATDSADKKASFSSFGDHVHVSAPGAGIYTTNMGGGYVSTSGTSFSAPITAGIVALMMSANPSLVNTQIEKILFATSVDLGAIGRDIYFGHGRVNASAAVQAALATVPVSDSIAPTVSIAAPLAGSLVKGTITVNVSASDNNSVSHVDLKVGSQVIGRDSTSPYSFVLDTSAVTDGIMTVTAEAQDVAGNLGTSSIKVTVSNIIDTLMPVIKITSPTSATVPAKGNFIISSSATDNIAVTSMMIYFDGAQIASSASGSISVSLNTRKISNGIHTIRIDAKDASGNLSTSSLQVAK